MRTLRPLASIVLSGLVVCAAAAGATADAGSASSPRVKIEVRRHAPHVRVVSAQVRFDLTCADGTRIERTVYLPNSKVGRHGGFKTTEMSGGNYGSSGHITVWVSLAGQVAGARRATGSFSASAIVVQGEWEPAIACTSGRMSWATG